jgi:hypothetical protein
MVAGGRVETETLAVALVPSAKVTLRVKIEPEPYRALF